jgi:AraC-like DNA-binding protein
MDDTPPSGLCTLHLGYLQLLLDLLRQQGLDPAQIYPGEVLTRLQGLDPNTRRPVEEWDQMMALAEPHLEGRDLPLLMGEFIKPWDTGAIGFITMASRTLREAGEALAQFYNLLNDAYTLQATVQGDHFDLRLLPIGRIRSARLERMTVATMAWHSRWLARRSDLRFQAAFAFAEPQPEQLHAYRTTFGDALVFNAPQTCLRGPMAYADHSVSRGDHGVGDTLRAQLMADMASLHDTSASFVHKVERLLLPRLPTGEIALEDIAQEAGVSVRTLQSRLEESGLTFRALLDRTRHAQVLVHLADPRLPLTEIGQMLGFATPSSFHHAFRRWTGMAPSAYRKRKLRPSALDAHPG